MSKNLFKTFFAVLAAFASFGMFSAGTIVARADGGLSVTPAVIDDHGLPRDIFNYTVTVKNNDTRALNVFAAVRNLTADGKQAFIDTASADKTTSLANWISVSRASMMLQPGETKTIPVGIQINPYAIAGKYHAVIAFVAGSTRDDAEAHLDNGAQVLVTLDVRSNAREELSVTHFAPTERFASKFPVTLSFALKSSGTVSSTPQGSVFFYDRVGHQIGEVNANPDNSAIAPGEKRSFAVQWTDGAGFGQYKAVLDLTYGAAGAKIEEVALVWVLPWLKLLLVFTGLLALTVGISWYLYRRYEIRHHQRMGFIKYLLSRKHADPVLDLRHRKAPAPPPRPPHLTHLE